MNASDFALSLDSPVPAHAHLFSTKQQLVTRPVLAQPPMVAAGPGCRAFKTENGLIVYAQESLVGSAPQLFEPPMPATPKPAPPVGFLQRSIGPDGYERLGVDFTTPCPVPAAVCERPIAPAPVASRFRVIRHVEADGGVNLALEEVPTLKKKCAVDPLMDEYRAACKAGNKAEAARLALQLLAKDPTCFGRD